MFNCWYGKNEKDSNKISIYTSKGNFIINTSFGGKSRHQQRCSLLSLNAIFEFSKQAPQRYIDVTVNLFSTFQKNHMLFHTKGDNGESGCNGDSGGPLYCSINGKFKERFQNGLSSSTFYRNRSERKISIKFIPLQASEGFYRLKSLLYFCGNELKQFGVASYANRDCKKLTGWWSPSHVMKWIQKNSDYRQTFPISFLNFLLHK